MIGRARRFVAAFLVLAFTLVWTLPLHLSITAGVYAAEIVVPDQYPTIQEAVNNANLGDTVFVRSGTYYEHVVVNKTVSLVGEDVSTTVLDGNNTGHVVYVVSGNVNITSFTVRRSGNVGWPDLNAGICLNGATGCVISENRAIDNGFCGISLLNSQHNEVTGNNVTGTEWGGIHLLNSSINTVSENILENNSYVGVNGHASSHYNNITENVISNSTYGMFYHDARYNRICKNNISTISVEGIWLQDTVSHNIVAENNLVNNKVAIYLEGPNTNNTLSANVITGAECGIEILNAQNNRVADNVIVNNRAGNDSWRAGIRLESGGYSQIHSNNISGNYYGILLYSNSPFVSVYGNNISYNEFGLRVASGGSYNLNATKNVVANNVGYGIGLTGFGSSSNYATLLNNTIANNSQGVAIGRYSNYNRVSQNYIVQNDYGFYIEYSNENTVYANNLVNNDRQAYVETGSVNTWDNGYPSGGNYWSDYNGTDANRDRIGDTPYIIDANNRDEYPLANPLSAILVPEQYLTIQAAVNNAKDGDTVFVRSGTYFEHLIVNKTVALVGQSMENTIIDGSYVGVVVNLTRDGIGIYGFTIRKSGTTWNIGGPPYGVGIYMRNVTNCSIVGNKFTDDAAAIQLEFDADGNFIANNTITSVSLGWGTFDASMNSFIGNNVTSNGRGLGLNVDSDNNAISGNRITASEWVIALHACHYNNITENYFADGQIGIYLPDSSYNRIYHNQVVNNTQQASLQGFPSHTNYWDDGYQSGGNYWSDYGGVDVFSGSYQNVTGSDGIGDTPLVIDGNNVDRFPLMKSQLILIGDINGDGKVDMRDVGYVARRFMCIPGDPLWDPVADVNGDSKINMVDIGTVARHFGEHV